MTESAFLVRLSITQWSPNKLDKQATEKTRADAGANAKSGVRVYKKLVSASALDAVVSAAGAARADHRLRTVPWQYDGPGAIAAAGYTDYCKAMEGHRACFNVAVAKFVEAYDREREEQRGNLGDLFNPLDYPPANEVEGAFSFSVAAEPMPESAHFKGAGLSEKEAEEIRFGIEARHKAAMAQAQAEAWDRITVHVEKMIAKLRAFKPATDDHKADGIFRDSLVGNIQELVNVMPSLNITNDPDLTAVTTRLQTELCALTAGQLREDDGARDGVATAAESIMREVWARRQRERTAEAA